MSSSENSSSGENKHVSSRSSGADSNRKNTEPRDDFSGRLRLIADSIKEIDEAILARRDLNKKIRDGIEKEIQEIQHYRGTLQPPWVAGFQMQIEFLRTSLHKSLCSRKNHKRSEDVKLWQDMVSLLKERRSLIMEYHELLEAQKELGR